MKIAIAILTVFMLSGCWSTFHRGPLVDSYIEVFEVSFERGAPIPVETIRSTHQQDVKDLWSQGKWDEWSAAIRYMMVGHVTFTESLYEDDKLYILVQNIGYDVDQEHDNTVSDSRYEGRALGYGHETLAWGSDLKTNMLSTNPITGIISIVVFRNMNSVEEARALTDQYAKLLVEDLNEDGTVNYHEDALAYSPLFHRNLVIADPVLLNNYLLEIEYDNCFDCRQAAARVILGL